MKLSEENKLKLKKYGIPVLILIVGIIIGAMFDGHGRNRHRGYGMMDGRFGKSSMMENRGDVSANERMQKMHAGMESKYSTAGMSMEGMNGMDMQMAGMMEGLQGKSGDTLDRAFLQEMTIHHQGAIDMAKLILNSTSSKPELKKFAQSIIDAQSKEISNMQEWQKTWFGK